MTASRSFFLPRRRLHLLVLALLLAIGLPAQAAQVTLAWDANTPAPDGYRLYQRMEGGSYNYASPAWSGTTISGTLDHLADDTTYFFVVRAFSGSVESADSNEVSFRTVPAAPATYTITASAGPNGGITPSGTTSVTHGGSQTYTISADNGHHIADVRVNGNSVGAVSSYTFTQVSADQTISATFAVENFNVYASAGEGGAIAPAGNVTVASGGSQTFSIHPDAGYQVRDVLLDGRSLGAVSSHTLHQVGADHHLEALFLRTNLPPVADAGPDQTVEEAQWVTLSGLNSHDPDDGIAAFMWRQIQGPLAALDDPTSPEAVFPAPDVGVEGAALVFELQVTDHSGATAFDTCIVNVTWVNRPPTAQAGADQTVHPGDRVVLDAANSVDPDDGIAAYRWVQTIGPVVELSDPRSVQAHFVAPDVSMAGASLRFELTVTDHGGLQDKDNCVITVAWANARPTADAGPDQEVVEGQEVILDGSLSSDPDDGIAAYRWKQTGGPPVGLSDPNAVQPTFIAPDVTPEGATLTFRLTVTDHGGLQHDDQCMVNVLWENRPPIASAGGDQTVKAGDRVQLDGTGSSDPDDGIADFQWSQTGGPAVVLSDPGSAQPTFVAPEVGPEGASLEFQLTVIDYSGLKSTDRCVVNVTWLNQPPVADAGADQVVFPGERVTLDGSASWDSDDGIAAYRWRQVSGPPVSLSGAHRAVASFRVPKDWGAEVLVFELTVTDHGGLQGADRCGVEVQSVAPSGSDRSKPSKKIR